MYETLKTSQRPTLSLPSSSRKITPGPYRATKLWNEIVRLFKEGMPRRRHRRHLKMQRDCFMASDAIDFLHNLLKQNHNIGSEVTRLQTIQLLRKFLKNHIIEDIHGKWGREDFHDDNHLYRFSCGSEMTISEPSRQPLSQVNENILQNRNIKKTKPKTMKEMKQKSKKTFIVQKPNTENDNVSEFESPSSCNRASPTIPRPLPSIPRCEEQPRVITDVEINQAWGNILVDNLKRTLCLDSLDDLLLPHNINGEWIKHNATKVGKSGVVQVPVDQDLPYWALSAMTCLANWPNGKNSGLPCYPGFEKDVFKAICDYYCKDNKSASSPPPTNLINRVATEQPLSDEHAYGVIGKPFQQSNEPLLTFDLYEIFTNILCLLKPKTHAVAVESLKLCLMLLPPPNRRKLHLLLRLISKVLVNPHLRHMSRHISTRILLLQTFSRHILSCFEEVHLDELLAMRLVTFLIDNHKEVMNVPENLSKEVEEKLTRMKRPNLRYGDGDVDGSFVQYTAFPASDVNMQTRLSRSKSEDVMKSLVMGKKCKVTDQMHNEDLSKHRRSMTCQLPEEVKLFPPNKGSHHKSSTLSSKVFNLRTKSSNNKTELKAAQSCPDICDRFAINPSTNNLPSKTSFSSSNRNLKTLFNKLKRNRT